MNLRQRRSEYRNRKHNLPRHSNCADFSPTELWCEWALSRPPLLRIFPKRRHAHVELDLGATSLYGFSSSAREAIIAAFERADCIQWTCGGDAASCKILIGKAETLARELLAIVEQDVRYWYATPVRAGLKASEGSRC
jgi:hypothetical protein